MYGVMETAEAVFKRYRHQFMSAQLSEELAYSQQFVVPLLDTLTAVVGQITAPAMQEAGHLAELKRAVLTARLACRTFFSLNSPGLTQACSACSSCILMLHYSLPASTAPASSC